MSTQGGGSGSCSGSSTGSGSGAEPISEQLREFISSEISHRISEILDECLDAFHVGITVVVGAHTLSFREFLACGTPAFHGKRDLIVIRWWLTYMDKAFRMSFSPKEAKVRYVSCLLKDRAQDWWEEVNSELGDEVVDAIVGLGV